MQTSIRLLLSALLVSAITYAAAGAPIQAQSKTGEPPTALLASAAMPAHP